MTSALSTDRKIPNPTPSTTAPTSNVVHSGEAATMNAGTPITTPARQTITRLRPSRSETIPATTVVATTAAVYTRIRVKRPSAAEEPGKRSS